MRHERNELPRAKRFPVTPIETMFEISSNRHHYISTSQIRTGHIQFTFLALSKSEKLEKGLVPLRYSVVSINHVILAFEGRWCIELSYRLHQITCNLCRTQSSSCITEKAIPTPFCVSYVYFIVETPRWNVDLYSLSTKEVIRDIDVYIPDFILQAHECPIFTSPAYGLEDACKCHTPRANVSNRNFSVGILAITTNFGHNLGLHELVSIPCLEVPIGVRYLL